MAYLFYSLCFFVLVFSAASYLTRSHWLPLLPSPPPFLYTRIPTNATGTFRDDVEAGLHSADFDLASNITDGDARSGLDATARREILKIMKKRKVDFNEARRIYTEQRFAKNNIGPDGMPRDPKFVSFS